nr:LOW QUALITY PROTEIN: thymidylate kinase-like [Hydra vulgaris]
MGRGAFVVLEGCDKSGKSTQCRLLVDYLNSLGKKTELWRFPERSTAIGQIINGYITKKNELHDKAVHLMFSANRWELVPLIKENIASGVTLVVDRYAYSGVAFTSAKGYDMLWCKNCDIGLPRPDAVYYMNIDIEDASVRGDYGCERYEVSDFQKKVQECFQNLKEPSWNVIDARESIDCIHKTLCESVLKTIAECENTLLSEDLFM